MPYRFPSGAQLKNWICQAVKDDDWIARELHEKLGLDPTEIKDFARTFQHSHINSIDAFLLKRPQFNEIGKFTIAAHLCKAEHPDSFDLAEDKEHWYRLLWNKMAADAHNVHDVIQNHVRFISFNYDRSLERFLFGACKNTYGLSDDEAYKNSSSFRITHVYGLLGKFHYVGDGKEHRAYDDQLTATTLRIAAEGIRLIPKDRADDRNFQIARASLDRAERICFLGFGFDPTNCENLGLTDVLNWKREQGKPLPLVFASTLGFTGAEVEQARKLACGTVGWTSRTSDNVMTLRELGVLA